MNRSPMAMERAEAAGELLRVIEAENEALARSDFGVSSQLAEAKRAAMERLEALIGAMREPGSGGKPMGDASIRKRLDTAIDRNRSLLLQAIDTQQRVIGTIVRALEPDEAGSGYSSPLAVRKTPSVALAVRV
ncbi:MAG TPA: hypothetical protein VF286_03845 [Acidiphilium sp.]